MKKIFVTLLLAGLPFLCFSYLYEKPTPALSKSLTFPVANKRAYVGSIWGDVRDGGKRSHEGIDIFAKKGTPVVAICDGIVTSVGNTPRGGKTVWLQSFAHPWTAYYAHLNEQKVRRGQFVKKGQILGTVGNTGNARTTPPHLHFGIYTWQGAVNPLPYVKYSPKISSPVNAKKRAETAIAKKEDKSKPVKKIERKPEASVLASKYIWKKITLPADPSSQYYVTTKSNVVRVNKGKLQVIGKWMKSVSARYPYKIDLHNSHDIYVTRAGKLVTAKGQLVGSVS